MAYALSTQGQGGSAFITLSTALANTSGTPWIMGGTFIVHDLSVNCQLLGASSSTQISLRVFPDGRLVMRSGATDRILSELGSVQIDVPFTWKIVNNITTGQWELYLNDMVTPVGTFARGTTAWGINQLARFSTTAASEITVREFYCSGGSYNATWNNTTAPGLGVGWVDLTNARALTLASHTGTADSWWQYYDLPVAPNLPIGMSTKEQGNASFISFTNWIFNANANSGFATIEADLSLDDFRGNAFGYIFGASGSTQNVIRVDSATMAVELVSGAVIRISSGPGAVVLGQRFKIKIVWTKSTGTTQMYINGIEVGTPWTIASLTMQLNQLGRYSTTQTSGITVYELAVGGACSTYNSRWDTYTILETGDIWPDLVDNINARPLTMTSATGTPNSWWVIDVSPPVGLGIKRWNGSAWVNIVPKRWNGSAWVDAQIRRYNGAAWEAVV